MAAFGSCKTVCWRVLPTSKGVVTKADMAPDVAPARKESVRSAAWESSSLGERPARVAARGACLVQVFAAVFVAPPVKRRKGDVAPEREAEAAPEA